MRCPACGSTDLRREDLHRFDDFLGRSGDIRVVSRTPDGPVECGQCRAYYPRGVHALPDEPCTQCKAYQVQISMQDAKFEEAKDGFERIAAKIRQTNDQLNARIAQIQFERNEIFEAGRVAGSRGELGEIQVEAALLRAEVAKLKGQLEAKQAELDKALGGKLMKAEEEKTEGTRFSLLEVD